MKRLSAILLFLSLLALPLLAATNVLDVKPTTPTGEQSNLLVIIIPLLVPIIVALAKKGITFLPSWTLPILASALGELVNWISGLLNGPTVGAVAAIALGAAGVGVREVYSQLKEKIKPAAPSIILAFGLTLGIAAPVALTGCTTLQKPTAYRTLYSVGTTTDAAIKSYMDLVVTGQVATNGVPRVAQSYDAFQAAFLVAVKASQLGTNGLAPQNVIDLSGRVISTIATAKGTP